MLVISNRCLPRAKSEVTIYFTDIDYIKISEVSFQKIFEIILYNEEEYFYQLSFHNKPGIIKYPVNLVFMGFASILIKFITH